MPIAASAKTRRSFARRVLLGSTALTGIRQVLGSPSGAVGAAIGRAALGLAFACLPALGGLAVSGGAPAWGQIVGASGNGGAGGTSAAGGAGGSAVTSGPFTSGAGGTGGFTDAPATNGGGPRGGSQVSVTVPGFGTFLVGQGGGEGSGGGGGGVISPGGIAFGGSGGGGGGALGINVFSDFATSVTITGGAGGSGGSDPSGAGGGGGGGGNAILASSPGSRLTIDHVVTGGAGGAGGSGYSDGVAIYLGGGGGQGGNGIAAQGVQIFVNSTVAGGQGGASGFPGQATAGPAGLGGAGISGSGLTITVGALGTVTGGLSGDSSGRAKAIDFTGGTNTLTLQTGSTLSGDIGVVGSLTFFQDNDYSLSSLVSGSGSISKTGSGTLTLFRANDYSGGTTVNAGTLKAFEKDAFGSGAMTVNASAYLDLNGTTQSVGSLAGIGTVTNSGGFGGTMGATLSVGTANTDTEFSGLIEGQTSLTKVGTGKLTLKSGNTYSLGTTVSGGTLGVGDNAALGTAGVTLDSGTTLQGSATSVTLGNVLTLGTPTGSDGAVTIDVGSSNALTLSSTIGQATGRTMGLTKTGSGTLVLAASASYAGITTVSGGILRLGAGGSLASATSLVMGTAAGAAFDLNDRNQEVTSLSGGGASGGNVTLGTGTLTVNLGTSASFAGAISGTGGLTKAGSAVLTLTGTNAYEGATTVTGGILRLGTGGSLASATSLVLGTAAGAAFDLNGRNQEVASLSGGGASGGNVTLGAGTLTVNLGTAVSYAGAISGGGGLTKTGSAVLTLTGANTYQGTTTVNDGILRLGTGGSLASATSLVMGTASGAAFDLNGRNQTVASLNGGGASGGNVTLGAGRLTVNGGGMFGGSISGAGSLTKTGTGVLTLTGTNAYEGATTVSGGTLRLGTGGSLASATSLVMGTASGAAFDLNGRNQEVASLSGGGASGGNVTLGAGTLTVNLGTAVSYAGEISGGGGLIKTGSAVLTLTGANNYQGTTTVNGGILRLGTGGSLASATSLVMGTASGAAFDLNGRNQTVASLNGGGALGGNVTLGTGRLTVNGGGTFGGTISGSGGLTKTGTGILTLTGANTYQSTTNVDGGILQLGTGGSLLNTTSLVLGTASGVAFDLNGRDQTVAHLGGGGTGGGNVTLGSGTLTVNLSGSSTFGGVVSGMDGKLVKSGGGTLTLTNANTYSGTTTITDGVLRLGVGGSINNSAKVILAGGSLAIDGGNTTASTNNVELGSGTSTLTVAAGQVLAWTTALTGSGNLQVGNSVGGTPGVFNLGSSTSNWSSYTGTITATNVIVDMKGGTIGGGGSSLSIGTGATLQGTGSFGGAVTIASGGTLSVGNSPGTQTHASLSLLGLTKFELGAANQVGNAGGVGNDLVVVTGQLTLGGTLQLLPSVANGTIANGYYRLFNYGTLGPVGGPPSSFASIVDKDGNAYGSDVVTVLTNVANQINIRFNAQQQTQYWTGTNLTGNTGTGPATQVLGGAGTWTAGTGQTNWSDSDRAEINNSWQGGVAVFAGPSAGTVSVDSSAGAIDVQGLRFTTSGYTVNGATGTDALTLTGNASASHVHLTTVDVGSGTATLGVTLVGSTTDKGIVKTGDGTLVLSGANSYTGLTKVEAGTLQVNTSGSITNSSGLTLANNTTFAAGGSIVYGNAVTLGIATGSGSVVLDVGSSAALTLNGPIGQYTGATMAVTKTGGGTLTLNGASTASGSFAVNEGTVAVGHNAALGAGTVGLAAGTTLKSAAAGLTLGNAIQVNGNASVDTNGFTLTLGGRVNGAGLLTAKGGGTLSLTNASTDMINSFDGGLLVTGGTTVLNTGALAGDITLDHGTLKAAAAQTRSNTLTIGAGGGTLDGTAGRLTFDGTLGGSGDLTTQGDVVLSGTALTGYTGDLTVNGTLSVASGAKVGTAGKTVTVASGGILGGTGTVQGAVTIQGGGKLAAGNSPGTLTVVGDLTFGNNATLDVDLTGPGIVGGSANDLTTIKKIGGSGGTLTIGSNVTVNLAAGSTTGYYRLLNYEGTRSGTFGPVTYDNGALAGGSTATLYYIEQAGSPGQANLLYKSSGQSLLFFTGGNLTGNTGDGPSNPTMTPVGGAGAWNTSQTNWTTAPTVGTSGSSPGSEINGSWQQGVAVFVDSLAAGADRTVSVATNAASVEGLQFATSGYTLTGGSLTLVGDSAPSGNPNATFIRTEAGVTASIGTVLQGAGIGIDKTGTGTLILTGANTFTGAFTVETGTLVVGNNDALGSAGGAVDPGNTVTLKTGTTLQSEGSADLTLRQSITVDGSATIDTNGTTLTLSGVLSKTSVGDTLTKAGTGDLTLSGDSSGFGGIMQVSKGSLTLASGGKLTVSSLTVASGTRVTVESGATLRGTGNTITNNETVVTDGSLLDDTKIVNNAIIQASGVVYAPTVDNNGTFTVTGALSGAAPVGSGGAAMTFNNAAGKTLDVGGAGKSFTGIGTLNNSGTVVMTGGTLGATTFNNNATANLAGSLTVSQFNNAGALTLNGNVTGATTALANLSGATITLNGNTFGGIGTLTNSGTIVGGGTLTGALAGTGTINLRPSGPTNLMQDTTQVLTIGQLTGNQTVLVALDPGTSRAGKIVATGGSTAGSSLTFLIQQTTLRPTASPVTLAQGLGAGTTVTAKAEGFSFDVGFVNTRLVNPSTGLWQVTTTVSPNAGAPAASVGSVITSLSTGFFSSTNAFVTSPSDTAPNAAHGGPWVRVQAGQYDTQAATTVSFGSLSSTAQTKVRTSFAGFQVGADYGLLNLGGSGVNVHAGFMAGSVNANGNQQSTAAPTKGSFSVPFVGAYTALVAGAFSADLQYRRDFYSMNISNAVGFTGTFENHKADGQSVNGSATYRLSLSDTTFLEPGVGFNYTRVDVDPFKAAKPGSVGVTAGSIRMQTVESLLGRASLRAGFTTVVDDKVILQPFVTAAVWHEFAKDQLSTFTFSETGEEVKITSGRVGTFGQAGLGVTGQIIGTNLLGYIRTDARFGDRIRGGSINMGVRYDF